MATGFPRLWSWAAAWFVVADRRAFQRRGFLTEAWEPREWLERASAETTVPTGAIRRGSFPDTPSGVAAGFVRRDGATRKRIHRSGSPGFLSQGTNQAQGVWNDPIAAGRESMSNTPSASCGGAGFSGRRAARDLSTSPPRSAGIFLFPENEPGPGVFFSGIPRLDVVGFFRAGGTRPAGPTADTILWG